MLEESCVMNVGSLGRRGTKELDWLLANVS
jgi:hypothetical protein